LRGALTRFAAADCPDSRAFVEEIADLHESSVDSLYEPPRKDR